MSFNFVKTGVLSERELSFILREKEGYQDKCKKATVTDLNGKNKSHIDDYRRISQVYFPKIEESPRTYNILQSLIIQEYAESNLHISEISEIQYVRYSAGGMFDWHRDIIRKTDHTGRVRGLTFSLNISDETEYVGGNLLVDVFEGNIVSLGRKKGSYIIFPSFLRHKAELVEAGVREAIVVWTKLTFKEIDNMKLEHENNHRNNLL